MDFISIPSVDNPATHIKNRIGQIKHELKMLKVCSVELRSIMYQKIQDMIDEVEDGFDPQLHFEAICKYYGVTYNKNFVGAAPLYPIGWMQLVENAIQATKDRNVELISAHVEYGSLNLVFHAKDRNQEVYMWRMADRLRKKSHECCMRCGEKSTRKRGSMTNYCETCEQYYLNKDSQETKKTGTWLDDY